MSKDERDDLLSPPDWSIPGMYRVIPGDLWGVNVQQRQKDNTWKTLLYDMAPKVLRYSKFPYWLVAAAELTVKDKMCRVIYENGYRALPRGDVYVPKPKPKFYIPKRGKK